MPPKPIRQLPTPVKQTTSAGVLSRIAPVRAKSVGLKVSTYGVPKTGKTRFACTFPKPLLLIGFEDGTQSVVGSTGVDFVLLQHTDEFLELISGPIAEGKYKSIVVDNATRMRDMKITEILGLKEIPLQKGWQFAKIQQWGECSAAMKEMFSRLWDAAKLHQANVIIIAQEANLVKDDESGRTASDLVKPAIGSAVGKAMSDFINAEVDYICQCCIREEVIQQKQTVGKSEVLIENRTGKKKYAIRVGPSEVYYTGFRQHLTAPTLPDFIDDPTYEKIKKYIEG